MLKGLPASGKTTHAKKLVEDGWKRVNKDEMRDLFDNGKWSGKKEKFILKMRDFAVEEAIRDGYNVVVDDTNLAEKHKKRIATVCTKLNKEGVSCEFLEEFIDTPLDVCLQRDKEREKSVGADVILKMYKRLQSVKGNF